jgi:hypothetical protein
MPIDLSNSADDFTGDETSQVINGLEGKTRLTVQVQAVMT